MEPLFFVDVLSRFLHVATAITVLGGSIFMRFALQPAALGLPEAEHAALRERIMARWRKIVGIGIGVFLLTGFYNYIRAMPVHKGDGLYHALMGTKILLSFAVFFLASALVGRSRTFDRLRANSRTWLAVTILLAAIVVAIAGFLKVRGGSPPPASSTVAQATEPAQGLLAND